MTRFLFAFAIAGAAAASPLVAQDRGRGADAVPPGHTPPPGMCRVWIDGVPPGQQPAPTDCATAVRNRPANGRVIFGDDLRNKKFRLKPPVEGAVGAGSREPVEGYGRFDRRRLRAWDDDEEGEEGAVIERNDAPDDDRRYERIFRRGSDVCVDVNRDGRCDDAQRGGTACVDADRTGVCDDVEYGSASAAGAALPEMISAVRASQGQRTGDVLRWFGDVDVVARYADADRNGVPDRVTWLDQGGEVVQIWTDRNRDGRADRVEFFRDGRRVKVIGQ